MMKMMGHEEEMMSKFFTLVLLFWVNVIMFLASDEFSLSAGVILSYDHISSKI